MVGNVFSKLPSPEKKKRTIPGCCPGGSTCIKTRLFGYSACEGYDTGICAQWTPIKYQTSVETMGDARSAVITAIAAINHRQQCTCASVNESGLGKAYSRNLSYPEAAIC